MVNASLGPKALPLGCLVVVFVASLTLFLIRDQRYIDTLPHLVAAHRNISAVIVQILSTLLSMAQMLVLCCLINFAARIKLFEQSTSVGNLSFWAALSMPRLDRTLPKIRLMFVVLIVALGPGLGALWSGSLTPLSSTTSRDDGLILTPVFNSPIFRTMYPLGDSARLPGRLAVQCNDQGHRSPPDPRGSPHPALDNCIVMSKLGNLIMTASTATNVTNPYQHAKIDNSTWTYKGRSYGKGSSTGLFNVTHNSINATDQGYSYEESGYLMSASCHQQSNIMFPFQQYYAASDDTEFDLWRADTVILDSGNRSILPFDVATAAPNGWNSHPFGYFAWTALSEDGVHRLITSGSGWSISLANISCTLDFIPTMFLTNVSKADQSITVTPLVTLNDFNQTGNITEAIVEDLDLMSRMTSSSLAYASLYTALSTNQASAVLAYPHISETEANELALKDSVEAIADDLLTYQGILAVARVDGESIARPVKRHFAAIKIGETKFHVAQLVINVVLCVVYILEASRTRGWKRLPKFDFVDIKALTLAALGPDHSTGDEKLTAFYEKDEEPRIRYAGTAQGLQHHPRNDYAGRTPSTDEGFAHHLDDLDSSQRDETALGQRDSRTTSYTSLRPLLGSPQRSRTLL
jgi:hypothetical protein